ncbi:hypothetical protein KDA_65420 [Dictyobacter alpinus]|uniref:Uncharacterized protein n=1 Tax=Dictyobacter alpinus TaxID=2014873 RepID=A0A402BI28_9CHLR|nr:hypothetical protein KDA_65420 [Dictyobacter alpinus]
MCREIVRLAHNFTAHKKGGSQHAIAPNYVRHLLTAFGSSEDRTPVTQGLIEPLL